MKKLLAFFRDGKFEEILGCLAILVVIGPVILNIINRSVLNSYAVPMEAVALLAYVWIGYGFFGYLYEKDGHVDVKFIVGKLPPRGQAVMALLRDVLILLFSAYMVYWGWRLFRTNLTRYATGTRIPLAVGYASIIFGFLSGAIRSFCAIAGRLIPKKRKEGLE